MKKNTDGLKRLKAMRNISYVTAVLWFLCALINTYAFVNDMKSSTLIILVLNVLLIGLNLYLASKRQKDVTEYIKNNDIKN